MNHFKNLILLTSMVVFSTAENVGWKSYLAENPSEFHDLPLTWEKGHNQTEVPHWLTGVFIRNGPAQHTFGSDRKHLGNYMDGFAKLHSFKLDGANVYFSGKMVESTTYKDSLAKGELVPQILLSHFPNPEDEWSVWEMEEIMERAFNQMYGDASHNAFDNNNPAVWRLGSKESPVYMVTTDYPAPQRFDIDTLETMELFRPDNPAGTLSGIAHWMHEPGTDNSITGQYKIGGVFGRDYFEVQRFTPDNTDYSKPEIVAYFYPKKNSMMHSFSITENYVIFIFSPVALSSPTCMVSNHFHITDCIEVKDEPSDIFIVNLKTGEVHEMQEDIIFSLHHINAYEVGDDIIVDLAPTEEFALRDYLSMEKFMNPSETNEGMSASGELTRITFNLKNRKVSSSRFPNGVDSELARYVNHIDFPAINEAYRGKQYCVIYGWSSFDYSRIGLVKKNVCDHTKDQVLYQDNHYGSEMYFIAHPEAKSEDDGVLVSITYDGEKEKSYFVVIDALTFTEIDRAYLPHNIPWSAHGMHFPDAKWTLSN